MTNEDTTARIRLEAAIAAVDYDAPAMDILDALLSRPEDLAEAAGLYTEAEVQEMSRVNYLEGKWRAGGGWDV